MGNTRLTAYMPKTPQLSISHEQRPGFHKSEPSLLKLSTCSTPTQGSHQWDELLYRSGSCQYTLAYAKLPERNFLSTEIGGSFVTGFSSARISCIPHDFCSSLLLAVKVHGVGRFLRNGKLLQISWAHRSSPFFLQKERGNINKAILFWSCSSNINLKTTSLKQVKWKWTLKSFLFTFIYICCVLLLQMLKLSLSTMKHWFHTELSVHVKREAHYNHLKNFSSEFWLLLIISFSQC